MNSVSWLFTDGALVWAALCAATAVAGPLAALRRRRATARDEAEAVRAALEPIASDPRTWIEGETVTIEGVLSASGALCARFEDGAFVAACSAAKGAIAESARASHLVVGDPETGRPLAELAGNVEVVVGALESRIWWVSQEARWRIEDAGGLAVLLRKGQLRLRSVEAGDRVLARGKLRRDAAVDEPGSYREERSAWSLVPDESGAVRIAYAGPPRVKGSKASLVGPAVLAAMAFAAASTLVGELAFRVVERAIDARGYHEWQPAKVHPDRAYAALAIALASPLHRSRALDRASQILSWRCFYEFSEAHVEQEAWVWREKGRRHAANTKTDACEMESEVYLRHHAIERALEGATACGSARALARAEYQRGHFDIAARALEGSEPPGIAEACDDAVALLLGDGSMAELGEARLREAERRSRYAPENERRALACVANAVEARRAHRSLSIPNPSDALLACVLLTADAQTGDARLATLDAFAPRLEHLKKDRYDGSRSERVVASLLALETALGVDAHAPAREASVGCPPRDPDDPALLDHPMDLFRHGPTSFGAPLGLASSVLVALERALAESSRPCARLMQVAVPVAAFEALSGDAGEARRLVRLVVDNSATSRMDRDRASAFRAAIEIRLGDIETARAILATLPADAPDRAELDAMLRLATGGGAADLLLRGHSRGVAEWPEGDGSDGAWVATLGQQSHTTLAGVAARGITRGHGALREWLRWGDKRDLWTPLGIATATATLGEIADAVGEPALAEAHRATASAFHRAIARRDIAVPLWALHPY